MKKVVLCIPSLATGGAEKFVVDLATNLDKDLVDVTVAVTRQNVNSIFYDVLCKKQVRVVDLADTNYIRMLIKQFAFLRREKPDIVHTNIGSLLHMMLATKIMRVPTKLYTVHNQADLLYGNSKLRKTIFKFAFNLFGYTPVAICDNVKESIQQGLNLKTERINKVHNGVDLNRFQPKMNRISKATLEIITTGTMYPIKNHEMIIEAFQKLHVKYPNIRLTILGDGEKRSALEDMVKRYHLEDVVSMPGIQRDVCSYLQKADVYVSASLTEGLPLSILEAMACGLPVVATDAGGTVDIVSNEKNGVVVPKNDLNALVGALEKMIVNDDFRKQCGEESLRIVTDWSIESCVRGYEKLYMENDR